MGGRVPTLAAEMFFAFICHEYGCCEKDQSMRRYVISRPMANAPNMIFWINIRICLKLIFYYI